MKEEIDSVEYTRRKHFLTHSRWDHKAVINRIQIQILKTLVAQNKINGLPLGLSIYYSSHIKKAIESVGFTGSMQGQWASSTTAMRLLRLPVKL